MYELSDKIKNLTPYETVPGKYLIRLDANEGFIPLPDFIRERLFERLSELPFNRYPDPMAGGVCRAFAEYYKVPPEFVTAGNGSDELIALLLGGFLNAGDKILCFAPDFSMYRFYADVYDKKAVPVDKPENLALSADFILENLEKYDPAAVVFSNPCNPTSLVLGAAEVERVVRGTNALVVVDEAYMDFSDQSVLHLIPKYDNLVVLKTCSKAVCSAGIRLGFSVAGEKVSRALKAVKSPYNVNSLTQAAGEILFSEPGFLRSSVSEILSMRDALFGGILSLAREKKEILRVFETAANFVFLEMEDAERVYERLKEKSILVRGFSPYLRITAGTRNESEALLAALFSILN